MKRAIFRARWVALPDFSLLENGALACEDGRIGAIERFGGLRARCDYPVVDFGDAVILPGLINAHAHLEYTLPHGTIKPIGNHVSPTSDFLDWLNQVIAVRMATPPSVASEQAAAGIAENLRNGTTTIADIATTDTSIAALQDSFVRKMIFLEVIDIQPESAEDSLRALAQRYSALGEMREEGGARREASAGLLSGGISPHAPYSVSERLLRAIVAWRRKQSARLAVHVAETPEEIALLRDGTGAMYDHFRELNFLPDDWSPKGVTPVRYLNDLGMLEASSLLVHCNYLTPEDVALIAASESNVVYCPGSHRFFSHARHPLPELLLAGVNVCLGTDSRASNESLDMVREMRFVKEEFPEIEWETILRLATRNAAQALGMECRVGQLSAGYECDLTVLAVESGRRVARLADVFDPSPPCRATIVAGEILFESE